METIVHEIATAHQAHTEPILWHYIKKQDKKNTKALLDEIINNTETDSNREIQIDKEIIYKRRLVANQETLDNLPMLTIGKKTVASRFLNSIRGA